MVNGLMTRLREAGVTLSLSGDKLRCQAPEGVMTEGLLDEIRRHKPELIDLIQRAARHGDLGRRLIPREARRGPIPLSAAQRRLWFLSRLEPESPVYHVTQALELTGPLDRPALEQALAQVVARHEPLRTVFGLDGTEPVQRVLEPQPVPLAYWNLGEPTADPEQAVADRLHTLVCSPFNLERGPHLLRAGLLRLSDQRHILGLVVHHIAFDGWSSSLLMRDLAALYRAACNGGESGLPGLAIQYTDFARWQREQLQGERLGRLLAYWRGRLHGCPETLALPTDHPRPPTPDFRSGSHRLLLDGPLTRAIDDLRTVTGTTLFMLLLAAFQVWLYRQTGQADLAVGAPIANRSLTELEDLIGFFANTLVLRADLADAPSFVDLLARVRTDTLDAYDHQDLPFDTLVEHLNPERQRNRNPLVQVVLALQSAPAPDASWGELKVRPLATDAGMVRFDLELHLWPEGDGLRGQWIYRRDLWEPATIGRMAEQFLRLLKGLVTQPERSIAEVSLQGAGDRQSVLAWSRTATEYPQERTIVELFEQQAAGAPHQTAVCFEGRSLSYRELNEQANRLAHGLIAQGVCADTLVGLCAERSPEMIVGLLGILKAGGAYVPLDPDDPEARLTFMLGDAGIGVLVTQRALAGRLPAFAGNRLFLDDLPSGDDASASNPPIDLHPEHLAYVLYTSGSTGRPKGVCVPHRAVIRLVRETDYVRLSSADRVAQAANVAFDAATFEVWGALLNGARLHILPKATLLAPAELAATLREQRISVLFLTTALFNQVANQRPDAFAGLNYLLFGGEQVVPVWPRRVLLSATPPRHLLHVYGPTENTTFSTWHRITAVAADATDIPIGRPVANTQVHILDERLQPVPIGVPGELCLAGDGLARGYLNRPELTAERFIECPGSRVGLDHDAPVRLYRTGDRARWRHDGSLEFLGRLDRQIKLRGFRIEPGEIEGALRAHEAVKDAVVVVQPHEGGQRLAAYLTLKEGADPADGLRRWLQGRLPAYMVPSSLTVLGRLPLTPNGKIDYRALPAPAEPAGEQIGAQSAPRNELEVRLTQLWAELLGLRQVGIHDNFFDLGGHSLLAVRLVARMEESLGRTIPLAEMLRLGTIAELVESIEGGAGATTQPFLVEDGLDAEEQRQLVLHMLAWPGERSVPGGLWLGNHLQGGRPPQFWCLPGSAFLVEQMAHHLGPDQPFYVCRSGWQVLGTEQGLVERMAHQYAAELVRIQPHGPCWIGGYCIGAPIALEMARQLQCLGREVALLWLVESSLLEYRSVPYEGRLLLLYGRDFQINPFRYMQDPTIALRRRGFPGLRGIEVYAGDHAPMDPLWAKDFFARLARGIREAGTTPATSATDFIAQGAPCEIGSFEIECPPVLPVVNGVQANIEVRLRYTGDRPWAPTADAGGLLLSCWYDAEGAALKWADTATELPGPVYPSTSVMLHIDTPVPFRPAHYRLELTLAEVGVLLRGERDRPTCVIDIEVLEGPIRPEAMAEQQVAGMQFFDRGQFAAAIGCFENASCLGPVPSVLPYLFYALCMENRYAEAMELHRRHPDGACNGTPLWLLMLSKAHQALGLYREALEDVRSARALIRGSMVIEHQWIDSLSNAGEHEEAEAAARQLIAFGKHNLAADNRRLARIQVSASQPERALRTLREIRALVPADPDVHLDLGALHLTLGALSEAEESYRTACTLDSSHAPAHKALAEVLSKLGRAEEGADLMDRLLFRVPEAPQAHQFAGAYCNQQENVAGAIAHWQAALKLQADFAPAHLALASVAIRQREWAEARARLEYAMRLCAHHPELHLLWGLYWQNTGEIERARKAYEKARWLAPTQAQGHFGLAILCEQQGNVEEALQNYRLACERAPTNPNIHFRRGRCCRNNHRPAEAIDHLREAIRLHPGLRLAYSELVLALGSEDQIAEALEVAQAAQERDAGSPALQAAMKHLHRKSTAPAAQDH